MLKGTIDGILAGLMIGIGGTVLLSVCGGIPGACFFTISLLIICYRGYSLYTGKIGFMAYNHNGSDFVTLLTGLFGNVIGTLLSGLAVSFALSDRAVLAKTMCEAKLDDNLLGVFIKAIFCGILMYLAVAVFKENKSPLAIFFCVPVFILSGFEHSIADMFYFFTARIFSLEMLVFLVIVILGNTVGGLLFPTLTLLKGEKKEG
ncbi:MAG: formate/nitrite transporter family protein [Ruminococcaceae bacterium]|nr:formate/nitrite transporter family protein [Oscillospiraceae bacterium]